MRSVARATGVALGVALALGGASRADASNTGKPRVPPSFLGGACIEVVDRSVDPVWSFDVGIPFEDTGVTEDEPPDSRTFQFFALCRSPRPLQALPRWVTQADAEVAATFDPTITPPGPEDVLDQAPAWAGCVQTITPVAERMPISCAATLGGASWDTTGVPAGAHSIWGYTYEPADNLWTGRHGVVRVIDGSDDTAGPAVSISWPLSNVTAGLDEGIAIAGCLSAMPGTTLTMSWATAAELEAQGDAAWQPFAELTDPEDAFEVPFVPDASLEYEGVYFQAEAVDPQGRRFAASGRAQVVFLAGCDPPQGGALSLPDLCGVGSGTQPAPDGFHLGGGCDEPDGVDESGDGPTGGTGEGATGASSSGGGDASASGEPSGCGCRSAPRPAAGGGWLVLAAIGLARRRRSQPS